MNKPAKANIFFSHSSRDSEFVGKIRSHIIRKTGGAFDIFQSSDGSSIRLGTNWLKKIEDALESCTIMFVFITKNSMSSPWIYFESGHAYSRKIQVIPIACMGCTMEDLRPPLTFLQGFNLNTIESFENIMAEINKSLDLHFQSTFNDFLIDDSAIYAQNKENDLGFIDTFTTELYTKDPQSIHEDYWDRLYKYLNDKWGASRNEDNVGNNRIFSKGCKFTDHRTNVQGDSFIRIEIDPYIIDNFFAVQSEIIDTVCIKYGEPRKTYIWASAYFDDSINVPSDVHYISGRLPEDIFTKDSNRPHINFWYKNIGFNISANDGFRQKKAHFNFLAKYCDTSPFPVREAIRELRKYKII
ncbi:MAG: toll/interleukin-1 receptor domain-containing protein [Planctomycetes bacterium]|nr:toll/interleukin-1 receptor domain-containing protein [Planctomycetota bacterium]